MKKTAETILKYQRSKEAEKNMLTIKEILNLIPGTKNNLINVEKFLQFLKKKK